MKGIFTSDQEKRLAELLDNAVSMKGLPEIIDGYLFKAIITFADDSYVDKINDDLKASLAALATACLDEDIDSAGELVAEVLDGLIDIPGIDDDAEALLFKGAVELIVAAIQKWIDSKKEEEEAE